MALKDALLPEFDQEMATTRRTLERVPDSNLAWKPHEKSMGLGQLAQHIATIPDWTGKTLGQDHFDVAPSGQPPAAPEALASTKAILDAFDKHVAESRAALAAASDEQLMQPWSLQMGGKTLFSMPRIAVLRAFVLSHSIHHRGQLSVYLRLNNVPVPSIYGPSADEQIF